MPLHRIKHGLLAALIVSAAWSAVATPVAASQPNLKHDRTQPQVMADAANQADAPYTGPHLAARTTAPPQPLYGNIPKFAGKSTPQREVFGFVNAGNLAN